MCDGFAFISETQDIPFHFDNRYLQLFIGNKYCTFEENTTTVIGQKRQYLTGGNILFHFPMPLQNFGTISKKDETEEVQYRRISTGTVRQQVDYYIDEYKVDSKYNKMIFSFPELDYFIPSSSMCEYIYKDNCALFLQGPKVITTFSFNFKGYNINFSLNVVSSLIIGGVKSTAETKSSLILSFSKTDDLDLLYELYLLVYSIFSFLCNRKNIDLDSVILDGEKLCYSHGRHNSDEITEERVIPVSSKFYAIEKFKENNENLNVIANTIRYQALSSNFEKLFLLFIDDKVSITCIHSSFMARNLLDLKQCLSITSSFEYYQRTFLPYISSESTIQVYDEVKKMIKEYADKQTGKKGNKAKKLMSSLKPTVSLQDKICKVYNGYKEWKGLKCILCEYFEEDVNELAGVANDWRNELAHEKREFIPDRRVISAMRLVEHLNYCIVLRMAGYADDEIKAIIERILIR